MKSPISPELNKVIDSLVEALLADPYAVYLNEQGHMKIEMTNHGHALNLTDAALAGAGLKQEAVPEYSVYIQVNQGSPGYVRQAMYYILFDKEISDDVRKRLKVAVKARNIQLRVEISETQKRRLAFERKVDQLKSLMTLEQMVLLDEVLALRNRIS